MGTKVEEPETTLYAQSPLRILVNTGDDLRWRGGVKWFPEMLWKGWTYAIAENMCIVACSTNNGVFDA
jgi:hypothetical protein